MKQSNKKLARGQMVYAPIPSHDSKSRSPFSSNKKILINSNSQPQTVQLQLNKEQPQSKELSPEPKHSFYNPLSLHKSGASPFHEYHDQLQNLMKQNSQFKAREQIYISKLMKLQEGLQKQHEQFMNLQELYNELFNLYKQKEEEITQLQIRYRQTERSRIDFNSKLQQNISLMSIDKMNSIKQNTLQQNFKNQLTQLIIQNKRINQINEKLISQLNYIKSKEKLNQSRQNLQQKVFDQLFDWQKIANFTNQEKIKLQYQNQFFKIRNQDLQKTITQLQKIISIKQTEIIKMRQEKFATRRQSSEKILNRSPPKINPDSARSKGSNQDSKKYVKFIQNLQKQNNKLREENLLLKENLKATMFQKQSILINDSLLYRSGYQSSANPKKKLQFTDSEKSNLKSSLNLHQSYQNENFNSQNLNEQYFSFSRQKDDRNSEQDLPTFPMDLQIQGIIRKHEKQKFHTKNEETDSILMQNQT